MWADTLLILFISICTALLGEVSSYTDCTVWLEFLKVLLLVGCSLPILFAQGVTWVLVYRTEKYQKLKSEIEKQSKKLEKKKEAHGEAANLDRSKKRKLEAVSNFFWPNLLAMGISAAMSISKEIITGRHAMHD